MRVIDIHAHMIPREVEELIRRGILGDTVIQGNAIIFGGKAKHPYTGLFTSAEERLLFMSQKGIDHMAVSVSPRLFFYHLPGEAGAEAARALNRALLETARRFPDRMTAVGTLPMQSVPLAIEELRYLVRNRVFLVQIGTSVEGKPLWAPEYEAFWAACEELGAAVMLHPLITEAFPLMEGYHLSNLVGNPWQTTAAAGGLIFSGVFHRHPGLKVLLVHGGGYLPYQLGRLDHGYRERPECRGHIEMAPSEYVRGNFYFDGLTHSAESLAFLLKTAGTDRVLFGSDYPYDMAEYDQREKLEALGFSGEAAERFCFQNARTLLKK